MSDTYLTLSKPGEGEFKDRGSKFLGYAYPAETEAACQEWLASVKKAHPKARHHCYAYRLGQSDDLFRANDDGEPSSTAGRPILGQIDRLGLTNVVVVVVRYFGGTLLGTSGFINAYRAAAAEALEQAEIEEKVIENVYRMQFGYDLMDKVMTAVSRLQLKILDQQFDNAGQMDFAIRQSEAAQILLQLKAIVGDLYLEEAEAVEKIEGFSVERID